MHTGCYRFQNESQSSESFISSEIFLKSTAEWCINNVQRRGNMPKQTAAANNNPFKCQGQ